MSIVYVNCVCQLCMSVAYVNTFLQTFVLTILILCFQEILSSKDTPRNFVTYFLMNGTLSICNGGKISEIYFVFFVE